MKEADSDVHHMADGGPSAGCSCHAEGSQVEDIADTKEADSELHWKHHMSAV